MKPILLSLLLLQGCVSMLLAEPAEPLVITVSTPIIESTLNKSIYFHMKEWKLPEYKCKVHGRMEGDVFNVQLRGEKYGKLYCLRCLRELLDEKLGEVKLIYPDEEFIREGKEDVNEMKRLGEK